MVIDKLKNWFMRLLNKNKLKLSEATEENVKNNDLRMIFHEKLRTELKEDEKFLIEKFEQGQISFGDLTEEQLKKINRGYALSIDKNLNKLYSDMETIKRLKKAGI